MTFNYAKVAGTLLFLGGIQFIISLIIAEAIYPGYSTSTNFISDLGVWSKPSAVIFNLSIMLLGVTSLAGAYFVKRHFKLGKIGYVFALASVGTLLVGIFPEDTFLVSGVPVIHAIAAMMAFLVGAVAAIGAYKYTDKPFNVISAVLGVASLVASVLFFVTYNMGSLGIGIGGMERMIAYPILLWTIGLGGYLLGTCKNRA